MPSQPATPSLCATLTLWFDRLPHLRSSPALSGDYGDNLRYAAFRVTLNLNSKDVSPDEALSTMSAWQEYVTELSREMPLGLQGLFQTTPVHRTWSWLHTQDVRMPCASHTPPGAARAS